jgi:Putative GTPase activating protein for Arf
MSFFLFWKPIRGLGTHISFVRSVRMDKWTADQIALMRIGGNDRCNVFLQSHDVVTTTTTIHSTDTSCNNGDQNSSNNNNEPAVTTTTPVSEKEQQQHLIDMIRQKYDNPAAQLYKQILKAERDGLPIPTELPTKTTTTTTNLASNKIMVGFGSSAPPPPDARTTTSGSSTTTRNCATPSSFTVPVAAIAVTGGIAAVVLWILIPH